MSQKFGSQMFNDVPLLGAVFGGVVNWMDNNLTVQSLGEMEWPSFSLGGLGFGGGEVGRPGGGERRADHGDLVREARAARAQEIAAGIEPGISPDRVEFALGGEHAASEADLGDLSPDTTFSEAKIAQIQEERLAGFGQGQA